ncbi:myb/SANT-like DNA-binding domain-containing protein 4 [Megalops cyprinoides]|uniref:myb/SANT-like DNA-binding domain-containing protein 4 n=1 Tax=Megalops cyprinoides TaxID=118141 RepID=UPI0018650A76|nr:myb/SANT-like DNA-binding domain-containing protein 4 [Megalops cyprinoides]
MKHFKRKRKSNYSARETQTLIREIRKRRHVLFSKQQNTAVKELKRRAWEEVADCVNALGEGELRTAAEVKRRYLDWRVLMKRKQVRAELSDLTNEYDPQSLDNDSVLSRGEPSLDLFSKNLDCDWQGQDLPDPSGNSGHPSSGVKQEGEGIKGERKEEEYEEDHFTSILPDIDRGGHVPEMFPHIDEFGILSGAKDATTQDPLDGLGVEGMGVMAAAGVGGADGTALLIALESQRLDIEKHRLQVERERLQVEKQRLLVEREKLQQVDVERERLQVERDRLQVEKERLRLLFQAERLPLASSGDCEKERKPWPPPPPQAQQQPAANREAERLQLEAERLELEKERLQFFKFESGRLQIEKERFQVERERMQLQKDGQQLALQQGH